MGLDPQELEQAKQRIQQKVDKDHAAAVLARNPERTISALEEGRDEEVAFKVTEIEEHLSGLGREIKNAYDRDCNAALIDLEEYANQNDQRTRAGYIRESLEQSDLDSVEVDGETFFYE